MALAFLGLYLGHEQTVPNPQPQKSRDAFIFALLSAIALCAMAATVHSQGKRFTEGRNDFTPFYSGAYALEQGKLYDQATLLAIEDERAGFHSEEHGYIRLPFHAAFLWPLSRLPYQTAYVIWQTLSLLAVVGFVALWRQPPFWEVLVWTSMSFAVLHVWLKGQDVNFLLLAIAVTALLHRKGRIFAAGLVFSLCAAKFHLFLLTPVLIFARRDWAFLRGLLSGGAVLALICFAVAGPNWPMEFLEEALTPKYSPGEANMPNLHGALSPLPGAPALEVIASILAAVAVWFAARRTDFQFGLAASLIGGLLLSRHSYLLDVAIILPACLTVLAVSRFKTSKVAAAALLMPPGALAIGVGSPYSAIAVGVALALLLGMGLEGGAAAASDEEQEAAETASFRDSQALPAMSRAATAAATAVGRSTPPSR